MFQLTDRFVFRSLLFVRLVSAVYNIIHDCDEVYNYWEPLHRLLYGYGKQTWEYSPEFALRSYLYLALHWVVMIPIRLIVNEADGKRIVFYWMRSVFALCSALLEFKLHKKVTELLPDSSWDFYLILLFNTGLFLSSTAFLPSTFSMYFLTAATVALLGQNILSMIVWSVVGVVLGWNVSAVAFLPLAVYVMFQPKLLRSYLVLFGSLIIVLLPLVFFDCYFYGKSTVSLFNFIEYNVIGGGQSALYGVESSTFYIRNAILNFNFALPLAAALPILNLLVVIFRQSPVRSPSTMIKLWTACAPAFIWILAISYLPHKEERFLYIVYPHICLSAALALTMISRLNNSKLLVSLRLKPLLSFLKRLLVCGYIILSLMRTCAIWINFRAPMEIYNHLPVLPVGVQERTVVCLGDEWHRFPSSFFLPSKAYRLGFLKQRFSGLLPADFSEEVMGTRSTQNRFNSENKQELLSYVEAEECDFLIDLESQSTESVFTGEMPKKDWIMLHQMDYLDRESTKSITRMIYIPVMNKARNIFGKYSLYKRKTQKQT